MEPQSKKNQVKHGKYEVSCPPHIFLKAIILNYILGDKRTTPNTS